MKENFYGEKMNLKNLFTLKAVLDSAVTTDPQPVLTAFPDKSTSEIECVAVFSDQIAFATKDSCRYLASWGTALCRGFFFRNPESMSAFVVHLAPGTNAKPLMKAIENTAGQSKVLDMYIFGGNGRCDFQTDEAYRWFCEDGESQTATAEEIDTTLTFIRNIADAKGIKINTRVVNLFEAKQTDTGVLDVVTGNFFYMPPDAIKRYMPQPPDFDTEEPEENNGLIVKVFG